MNIRHTHTNTHVHAYIHVHARIIHILCTDSNTQTYVINTKAIYTIAHIITLRTASAYVH